MNADSIVAKIERTVQAHRLSEGAYSRYLWQDEAGSRKMGVIQTQDPPIETHRFAAEYARTHACAGAKTGRTQPFAGAQFTHIR